MVAEWSRSSKGGLDCKSSSHSGCRRHPAALRQAFFSPAPARPKLGKKMEAPSGVEPLRRGFAIRSLSHLGTAPYAE